MADDRCGVCGARPPAGARFCHACGVPVDTPVIEVGQGPLDPGSESAETVTTRRGSRTLVLVAVLGVAALVGWVLVSGGTDDEEDAANPDAELDDGAEPEVTATPAPTPTVESVEATEPIVTQVDLVAPIFELPGHQPAGIIEHGNDILLFTTESQSFNPFLPRRGGSVMWSHDRATNTFTEVSQPLATGQAFGAATSSGDAVLVAGVDGDGVPTVWTSDDGSSWTSEAISTETLDPGQRFVVTGIAAFAETVVVTGTVGPDYDALLAAVPEEIRDFAPQLGFRSGSSGTVTLTGPLGLPIYEVPLDELGISPDQLLAWPFGLGDPGRTWVSTSDGWAARAGEDVIFELSALPNGDGVAAQSYTESGSALSFSADGLTWREDRGEPAAALTPWGNQLAVATSQEVYTVNLRGDRASLGLGAALGRSRAHHLNVMDASERLLTVAGTRGSATEPDGTDAVLLVTDGGALRYRPSTARLDLTLDDGSVVRFNVGGPFPDNGIEVDATTGTVNFFDTDSGQRLASTTIADLSRLERAAFDDAATSTSLVLAVTDGDGWSIDRNIGDAWPVAVEVTDTQLFLVAMPEVGFGPGCCGEPAVVVYAGDLPDTIAATAAAAATDD